MDRCRTPRWHGFKPSWGTWQWEAVVDGQPIGGGRTIFAWTEGGAFLTEHSTSDQPDFPTGTAMIGVRYNRGLLHAQVDSRGISRSCQMSLRDGVWRQWRDAPGFWQRFEGTFSDDGRNIAGRSESSADGT